MRLSLIQMRHDARNYLAVALAIILGTAFVTCSMLAGGVLDATTRNAIGVQFNGADVIVTSMEGSIPDTAFDEIATVPGIATIEKRPTILANLQAGTRNQFTTIAPLPEAASIRNALDLTSGRLPATSGEVLLLSNVADHLSVDVGGTFSIQAYVSDTGPAQPQTMTVSGITNGSNALAESNTPDLYVWPADMQPWIGSGGSTSLLITTAPGISPTDLVSTIDSSTQTGLIVRTHDQQIDAIEAEITNGTDILAFGLLAFAIIALFVAGIVIANTFAILVAQRSRNLALLRCAGATQSQVRRMVLTEAAILGIIASIAGVLLGIMVTRGGAIILSAIYPAARIATDTGIPANAVIVPFLLGTLATIIAAWGPANSATRIPPLAALRPQEPLFQTSRASLPRLLFTIALLGFGSLLLVGGMLTSTDEPGTLPLLIGIMGGMVSFCGVLVGALLIVPRIIALLNGLLRGIGGAPAHVATSNSARNPKRTTATATALLIAVTLLTMMSVGAATVKSTLGQVIDERSPIDVIVSTSDPYGDPDTRAPALTDAPMQLISGNSDVAAIAPAQQVGGNLNDDFVRIVAIDPDAARAVFRAPAQLADFAPGTMIVPRWFAEGYGLADGDTATLRAGTSSLSLPIIAASSVDDVVIASVDMTRLAPDVPVSLLWLKFRDGTNASDAVGNLQDDLEGFDNLWMTGGAQDKARNYDVLDTMLLIATALLGVAAVIAIVGVGNTLSLSVIERTRESAILRALGLTVRQLRLMLAMEGVILALAGAVFGLLLGIVYGFAGAKTLLGNAWEVQFAVPLGNLLLIMVIAIVAGLISSVLPARRAARVSPVEALAEA